MILSRVSIYIVIIFRVRFSDRSRIHGPKRKITVPKPSGVANTHPTDGGTHCPETYSQLKLEYQNRHVATFKRNRKYRRHRLLGTKVCPTPRPDKHSNEYPSALAMESAQIGVDLVLLFTTKPCKSKTSVTQQVAS